MALRRAARPELVRFAYHNGDLKATGSPEHVADLPGTGGHWNAGCDLLARRQEIICRRGFGVERGMIPTPFPAKKIVGGIFLVCDPANCL